MADLIYRYALIAEYDRVHVGAPGGARKLMQDAPSVNRWIPVSERLPEQSGYYLVCDSTAEFDNIRGRQDVSKFVIGRHGGHWYGAIRGEYITHWMPLPEPPESEVQE